MNGIRQAQYSTGIDTLRSQGEREEKEMPY